MEYTELAKEILKILEKLKKTDKENIKVWKYCIQNITPILKLVEDGYGEYTNTLILECGEALIKITERTKNEE